MRAEWGRFSNCKRQGLILLRRALAQFRVLCAVSHCGRIEIDLGYAPVAVLLESRDYAIATISEEDCEQRATGVGLRAPCESALGPDR